MINIVVPMAGRGSRFSKEGYEDPKPLIPVGGIPMIHLVIKNLTPKFPAKFIFLCLQEHLENYPIEEKLHEWAPGCEIVVVDQVTEGAACTVLLAEKFINNDQDLMIANCDQFIDFDINHYLQSMWDKHLDGYIMTMKADDPKWSFVSYDDRNLVVDVQEKVVISDEATVGIYNYRRGSDFVRSAKKMIADDVRVNGEFYVAPVYNYFIGEDTKIGYYNIGSDFQGMYGLGTPPDLRKFVDKKLDLIRDL